MYAGNNRRHEENWHYDRYKDPHEFPILDVSSDEERSEYDSHTADSSANLSKKLPQISDEKFKQILELRKQSKKRGKNLTLSNKINDLPQPSLNDNSPVHEDGKAGKPAARNSTTDENLLSASTPKVNNTVTFNEEPSSTKTTKSNKNISHLLLQQDSEAASSNDRSPTYSGMEKLIETLQEQMQQINDLEVQLNKSKIQVVNLGSKIVVLENENSKLARKAEQWEAENKEVRNYQKSLLQEISYCQEEMAESENKYKYSFNKSSKLDSDLKKEKLLLKKERDMHKKIIKNYDSKLESLHDEKIQALNLLEQEKNETVFWKKKSNMFEDECKRLEKSGKQLEEEKENTTRSLKTKIKELTSECELLRGKNAELATYEDDYIKLNQKHKHLTKSKDDLQSKVDSLSEKNTQLSTSNVTLKAELTTKLEIVQNELVKVKEENYELNISNQSLKSEIHILNEKHEDFTRKMLGASPITDEQFGARYKSLEMEQVDQLTLMELQNIVKNILSSLNIKYSGLKGQIVFIRDHIFVFFNNMHSILHSEKRGNSVIIDRSIKLDTSDEAKMKACMDLLLQDIKQLKGISGWAKNLWCCWFATCIENKNLFNRMLCFDVFMYV